MKVNVKSWHYRTASQFDWQISNSLCTYFWQVVWAAIFFWLIAPVLVIVAVAMLFFALPLAAGKLILPLFGYVENPSKWVEVLWCTGAGYLFFFLLFMAISGFVYYRERKPKNVERPDSLLVSYIQAKKRKICPVIEFTRGENEES